MPREPVYGESQAVMNAAIRGELRVRTTGVFWAQDRQELIPDKLQIQGITPFGYPGYGTKFSWPAYMTWMTYAQRIQQVMHDQVTERANLEEVISCATWNRLRKKWACKHPGGAWPSDSTQDLEC